jgi:hypothetical protein
MMFLIPGSLFFFANKIFVGIVRAVNSRLRARRGANEVRTEPEHDDGHQKEP